MKKHIKKLQAIFLIFFLIFYMTPLVKITVHAASTNEIREISSKNNVPIYKNWTIVFTSPVNPDTINNENITVSDSNSKLQDVNVSLGNDNKSIIVNCPAGGYSPGETYFLNINDKVTSANNESIKKSIKMAFITSSEKEFSVISPSKISSNVTQIDKDKSENIESHIISRTENENNNTVITLDNSSTSLNNSKPGDIFLMDSTKDNPFGLAGKVVSNSTTSDGKNVLEITKPGIDEVLSEANFNIQKPLTQENLISSTFPEGTTISFVKNTDYKHHPLLASLDNSVLGSTDQYSDINISLPKATYTIKGDSADAALEINSSPSILIKSPTVTTELDFKKAAGIPTSINKLEARLNTTIECDEKINIKGNAEIKGSDISKALGYDNSNKISIGSASLSGVSMEDKIILGSMTYQVGTVPVETVGGIYKDIPLGVTIFLYLTFDGKIEASADVDVKASCYIDKGISINGISADNQVNLKNNFSVNGNLAGDLKCGVGAGLGVIAMGIIPADVTVDLISETNGNVEGGFTLTDHNSFNGSIDLSSSLKLSSEGNLKVEAKVGDWSKDGSKKVNFSDKTLYECKLKYPKAKIQSIDDINKTINEGDEFTLPSVIIGNYDDGRSHLVLVTWNPSTVDTKTPGTYSFEGIVEGYDKKIKLTLTVKSNSLNSSWISISSHFRSNFGIKEDGSLWAWGNNDYGQLGDGTTTDNNIPTRIGSDNDWASVAAGETYTTALKKDGSLWAWGGNYFGQLGDGTTINKNFPTKIGSDNDWASVISGSGFTTALKKDGSLWGWGANDYGQLGDGTKVDKKVPTRIGSDNNWKLISSGINCSFAIKKDSSLWAWGYNNHGQLGDSTTINKNIPTRIGSGNDWAYISSQSCSTLAIKKDGSLWSWGSNTLGQLGDGTKVDKKVPTRVGSDNDWNLICAGDNSAFAIKKDGSLWAWGNNWFGKLGDGTMIDKKVPTRIGSDNNWKLVVCNDSRTFAIKKDGSLWGWGFLGLEYSPDQVSTPLRININ